MGKKQGIRLWRRRHWGEVIYLLDHTTSIHLKGKLQNVPLHGVRQSSFLNLCSVLEQLLNDVISENVLDKLEGVVGNNLAKDDLFLITSGRLKLLLDET